MRGDFHQSPRSRVAEAEKQLRIARDSISEEHDEVLGLLDETTRELKEIGNRLDTLEHSETADEEREPPAMDSSTGGGSSEDERPAEYDDVDAPSGESRRDNTPSEGPHAR